MKSVDEETNKDGQDEEEEYSSDHEAMGIELQDINDIKTPKDPEIPQQHEQNEQSFRGQKDTAAPKTSEPNQ